MKKEQKVALKTMAIKAKVYNFIRKTLYTKFHPEVKFSDEKKLKFFDDVHELNLKAHRELNEYKRNRKKKAQIQKDRDERGYKPKVRTSKTEYLQSKIGGGGLVNENGIIHEGAFYIPISEEGAILTKETPVIEK